MSFERQPIESDDANHCSIEPSVSIVLATYNGAKYIEEQLISIARQSLHCKELVIVDDASVDDTVAKAIDVIDRENLHCSIHENPVTLGYTKSFEKALSLCSGDIVFLCDQDDYWFTDKVISTVRLFEDKDLYVIQNDMILTDGKLSPTDCTQLGNTTSMGLPSDEYFTGCGMAIKRPWLEVALPIPSQIVGHDRWLSKLATYTGVRWLNSAPLQYYRRHDTNASQSHASELRKMNALNSFLLHGFSSSIAGWMKELEFCIALLDRLNDRRDFFERYQLTAGYESGRRQLEGKISAIQKRIANNRVGRIKRLIPSIKMYVAGEYRHFSGLRSFLKDVVRP